MPSATMPRGRRINSAIMVGEVCRFYGWSVEYALNMPAVTFFVMQAAMRTLDAYEKLEQIDIAAVAIASSKWVDKLKEKHWRTIEAPRIELPDPNPAPVSRKPVLEGQEAHDFLRGLFNRKKVYG